MCDCEMVTVGRGREEGKAFQKRGAANSTEKAQRVGSKPGTRALHDL